MSINIDLLTRTRHNEVDGSELLVTVGNFHIRGTRRQWQSFIDDIGKRIEELPSGIDISSLEVELSCTTQCSYKKSVSAGGILQYEDDYENGMWLGTEDELHDAILNSADQIDNGDIQPDSGETVVVDEYFDIETEVENLDRQLSGLF